MLSGVLLALALALPVQRLLVSRSPCRRRRGRSTRPHPDRWVGDGTPASCTSRAVVRAVAKGGIIRFDCGPDPVTIAMEQTAKVVNTSKRVVIDGGGLVTLSGGGERRILYQNTCDPTQVWTTDHCEDQATPRLVVQHLTFADGNSTGETTRAGAAARSSSAAAGSRSSTSTFRGNRCDRTGPDLGGAAVRALVQYHGLPVYVVGSTFTGGRCSNGSAAEQHRRLVVGLQHRPSPTTGRSAAAPTRPSPARPAAAAAGRSTPTATTSRCWSPAPR